MHTDFGSQSESEEFAEPSFAVISALDESIDDDPDWHVDINIIIFLALNNSEPTYRNSSTY